MCLAIPYCQPKKNNTPIIWQQISSSPLKMLSFAGILQLLAVFIYLYLEPITIFNSHTYHFTSVLILLSILPLFIYALAFHYYPLWLRTGSELEYLDYALYFFIGNFNFVLILVANVWSNVLLSGVLIFQLLLIIYVYKPLRWLAIWANKKDKKLIQLINFMAISYWLVCLLAIGDYLGFIHFHA